MRVLMVVNPAASTVTPRRRRDVLGRLRMHHDVDVAETRHRGHAIELASRAVAAGVDCVAVLGGDGTVNEAANGLVGTGVVLAPLPGGSTNVFARTVGLPRRAAAAADAVAAALAAGCARRVAVGRVAVDGRAPRLFVCHTGVGWDAALVAEVEHHSRLKGRATVALYTWAGVRAFTRFGDRSRPRFHVSTDGSTPLDGCFALVQVRDPYTFAGPVPLRVSPRAGDGKGSDDRQALSVTTLERLSAPVLLRATAEALGGRGVNPSRGLSVRTGASRVTIHAPAGVPYQVDGDHLGDATRLRFDHVPGALRVVGLAG